MKGFSTAGDKRRERVYHGLPCVRGHRSTRRADCTRASVLDPWLAKNQRPPEADGIRQGDRMARRSRLCGPFHPARILRGDRASHWPPYASHGSPLLPRDDCDDDLREDETEEEIRARIRTRSGVRCVRPRARGPRPRRLVAGPVPRARLERVDLHRKCEVEVRQAPAVVGRQGESNGRPGVVDVRMVVHRLCKPPDPVDERESLWEVLEGPRPRDRIPLARPPRDLGEPPADFLLGQAGASGHRPAAREDTTGEKLGAVEELTLNKVNTSRTGPGCATGLHRTITMGVCVTMSKPHAMSSPIWSR